MQTYLKTKPALVQLLLFIGMALGILVVFSMIGFVVLSAITGINAMQMSSVRNWDVSNPQTLVFIRGMILVQFLGLFLIPSLLFGYLSDRQPLAYLGLKAPSGPVYWILGVAALLVSIPLIDYIGMLNQKVHFGASLQQKLKNMEWEAQQQVQFMLKRHTLKELMLNLIFVSLFAGIGEELFFRGVLQKLFIRLFKSPWAGIIFTAIIFSGIHLQFFGFFPRLILGVLLGVVYWYSGSLWPAILAHFLYDALIIVLFYIKPEMAQETDATLFKPAMMILPALISAAFTASLVWYMKRQSTASYAAVYRQNGTEPPFTFERNQ